MDKLYVLTKTHNSWSPGTVVTIVRKSRDFASALVKLRSPVTIGEETKCWEFWVPVVILDERRNRGA